MDVKTKSSDPREALLQAVQKIKHLRAENEELRARASEPIAILGIGCRFPGGVDSPESYWRLLTHGVDAIQEVPRERWDIDAYYDPNPDAKGKMITRWGGFLGNIDLFEPAFFGISPREAVSIDPQQRLLLETSWEALERARMDPGRLAGSHVGVYIGICGTDYQSLAMAEVAEIDAYSLLGTAHSASVGRLSYWLGLKGPNMPIDTACSSSLVAVHLACQALRTDECSMALAGGVNVILSPHATVYFSRLRALSPTGRCHTFSADADGYVRGEGCGIVVLKRLSDAQRDGDPILAVIRGSAINQDGRSNGLTAPNGPSQEAVIRQALRQGGVQPSQVGYVEAHGTGTLLGDPIEVQALGAVLSAERSPDAPLIVGSVKTNIGHAEGAAGIAGLIKAVLCLQHATIPKSLHFQAPNPHIPWSELKVAVASDARPWQVADGQPRIAGVSSFGISGTNAHVILAEAPPALTSPAPQSRSAELVVLSARSQSALHAQAERLLLHLRSAPELALPDLAYSLGITRCALPHRLAISTTSIAALQDQLTAIAQGASPPGATRSTAVAAPPRLAFLFTGQGAQIPSMGRGLYADWPAFRAALDQCTALFDPQLPRPLREVMWAQAGSAEAALLDQTAYTQPALFALEFALSSLWSSWGVRPAFVAGHSLGELVAACVAGVFSMEDAVRLCSARARLMQQLPSGGAMVSIAASEATVAAAVAPHGQHVAIAAINGSRQVVISGVKDAVSAIAAAFSSRGVKVTPLRVSHAFHSPLMEPMLAPLRQVAQQIAYRPPAVALVSNVSGKICTDEVCTAEYWVRHVRESVRFGDGLIALYQAGARTFVELGPKPTLLSMMQGALQEPEQDICLLPSLLGAEGECERVLAALAAVWTQGIAVDMEGVFPAGGRRVELPTQAWERERYWLEAPARDGRGARSRAQAGGHPLLGNVQTLSTQPQTRLWETVLDLEQLPWLADHLIEEAVVFPGAAYVEMALSCGAQVFGTQPFFVTDMSFIDVLVVGRDAPVPVQAVLTEEQSGELAFQVASRLPSIGGGAFRPHARGVLRRPEGHEERAQPDLAALQARLKKGTAAAHYAALKAMELDLGPSFQGISEVWYGEDEALGRVQLPEAAGPAEAYQIHPALLDALFQVTAGAFISAGETTPWVPVAMGSLRLWQRPAGELFCYAQLAPLRPELPNQRSAKLWVVDRAGAAVAEIQDLTAQRLARGVGRSEEEGWFLALDWEPAGVPAPKVAAGRWLLLGDGDGTGAALRAALESAGQAVVHAAQAPQDEAGLRALLAEAFAGAAPTAIVHLGSLTENQEFSAPAFDAARVHGCDSVLCTVQALIGMGYPESPRLWIVTRGAQADLRNSVQAAQAPLLGLGRVIAVEHRELRCVRVDLDPGRPAHEVQQLLAELLADDAEDEIALRGQERRVARLTRQPPKERERPGRPISADGSYLVTGGLGGLGLRVASWLAEQGAGHLVLVGRTGAVSAEQEAAVAALEAKGTRVTVAIADVAERAQLEPIFHAIATSESPLRGVIHAAGLLDDGLLMQQTPARFRAVMRPKVQGAIHLHELTCALELDFFVLYASGAGLLGSPGQGSYAAANSFLDALAHHRRACGLPGLSIDWGAFSEVGLAARSDRGAQLAVLGLPSLTPAQGLRVLGRLLASDATQIGVVPLNLRKWAAAFQTAAASRMWSRLFAAQHEGAGRPARDQALPAKLAAAGPEARIALLQEVVRAEAARVLRVREDELDVAASLTSQGMDSLMGLELRGRIESVLGIKSAATLLSSHPSVAALSAQLAERVQAAAPRFAPPAGADDRRDAVHKAMLAYCARHLATAADAGPLRDYLSGLGLAWQTWQQFELGALGPSSEEMMAAVRAQGFSSAELQGAGILPASEVSSGVDVLAGRLLLPVRSAEGRLVALIGRQPPGRCGEHRERWVSLEQGVEPWSVTFGLHLANAAIHREDLAIFVSDLLDVLSAHQLGAHNVVSAGSASAEAARKQLAPLYRMTDVLGGDEIAASLRSGSPDDATAGIGADAQEFRRHFTSHTLHSREARHSLDYFVLRPANAAALAPTRRIPLLLILPGGVAVDPRPLNRHIYQLMCEGAIPPMAIITPIVERPFYLNSRDGTANWESALSHELVEEVQTLLAVTDPQRVGLMGMSMGGLGALRMAFRSPDRFAAVAVNAPALAPAVRYTEVPAHTLLGLLMKGRVLEELYGSPVDGDGYWTQNNPSYLAQQHAAKIRQRRLSVYLDCGTEDLLARAGTHFLHEILLSEQIAHEMHWISGARHNRAYFSMAVLNGLRFMARVLTEAADSSA